MPRRKQKQPSAPGPFLMIPLEFYQPGGPLHPGTDCAMTTDEFVLYQIVCSRGPNKCESGVNNPGRVKGERIATLASIRAVVGWTDRTILARLGTLELKGWIGSRKGDRVHGRRTPTVFTITRNPWLPGWNQLPPGTVKARPKACDQLPRKAEGEGWFNGRERKRDQLRGPRPALHPAYLSTGTVDLESTIPGAANASPTPCISPLSEMQPGSVTAPGGNAIGPDRPLPRGADVVDVKHLDSGGWWIKFRLPGAHGIRPDWAGSYPTRKAACLAVEASRAPLSNIGGEP